MNLDDFNRFSEKIVEERNILNNKLLSLLDKQTKKNFNELNISADDFFAKFEIYLTSMASKDSYLTETQVNDVLDSIKNVFDFLIEFYIGMDFISKELKICFEKPKSILITAQKLYYRYRKQDALEYKEKFNENKLPSNGFRYYRGISLKNSNRDWVSIIIGLLFCAISLFLVFLLDINTSTRYIIVRGFISVGLSLLITGINKDFVETKFRINRFYVTAAGAAAIFLITYFINPASPPEYRPDSEIGNILTD